QPTGLRRWVQGGVVVLADWLPATALLASLAWLLWRFFDPMGHGYNVHTFDLLLPLFMMLIVLIILHVLIAVVLPLRWLAIRDEFERRLADRLREDLEHVYAELPAAVAEALQKERRQVEQLLNETREVTGWLEQRE